MIMAHSLVSVRKVGIDVVDEIGGSEPSVHSVAVPVRQFRSARVGPFENVIRCTIRVIYESSEVRSELIDETIDASTCTSGKTSSVELRYSILAERYFNSRDDV